MDPISEPGGDTVNMRTIYQQSSVEQALSMGSWSPTHTASTGEHSHASSSSKCVENLFHSQLCGRWVVSGAAVGRGR
jgi:hypothetical protein